MQGNKLLLTAMRGLTALLIATPVWANMSAPMGWYAEGNVGTSHLSNTSAGSTSRSGVSGNLNVGYKFMPYVAGEIGYSQYSTSTVDGPNGTKAGTIKHYSYDLAAKGILPISDSGFEAFAKLGVQRLNARGSISNSASANAVGFTSSQHNATGLYMGIGGQYYFTPELAAVVQWQRAQGDSSTGNEDLYSVGLSFIFG